MGILKIYLEKQLLIQYYLNKVKNIKIINIAKIQNTIDISVDFFDKKSAATLAKKSATPTEKAINSVNQELAERLQKSIIKILRKVKYTIFLKIMCYQSMCCQYFQ